MLYYNTLYICCAFRFHACIVISIFLIVLAFYQEGNKPISFWILSDSLASPKSKGRYMDLACHDPLVSKNSRLKKVSLLNFMLFAKKCATAVGFDYDYCCSTIYYYNDSLVKAIYLMQKIWVPTHPGHIGSIRYQYSYAPCAGNAPTCVALSLYPMPAASDHMFVW